VRPVPQPRARLREAARLGFTRAIVGAEDTARLADTGLEVHAVTTVSEAWDALR
jgi:DNA repair protein RadA/Sms